MNKPVPLLVKSPRNPSPAIPKDGATSTMLSDMLLLFGLPPTDKATIAGAMLLLATVAALSGWLPARRAASIDPMEVLREG